LGISGVGEQYTAKTDLDLAGRRGDRHGGPLGLGRQWPKPGGMGASRSLRAARKERCLQAAEELQKLGVKVLAPAVTSNSPPAFRSCRPSVKQFGRIDILINMRHFLGRQTKRDA